ncbi:hypothetical protein OQA88_11591 [Cercophora sp. LCS_1]
MRLLSTATEKAHEFFGRKAPRYAILSHTWGEEEVTFRHLAEPSTYKKLKGYAKIRGSCEVARREGFRWIWIDTCCIDKSSSAELSEAINSMFKWYEDAAVCYAYLPDVASPDPSTFSRSRWFTRGWTLQELIAPSVVVFLDSDWEEIGTKTTLVTEIASVTGIDKSVLVPPPDTRSGPYSIRTILHGCSTAQRMSWAAKRSTTRIEDQAYSLMGIFDVNMPLLYGEGTKAFLRLQMEIMNNSDDMSIFVWSYHAGGSLIEKSGLLAPRPACFEGHGSVRLTPYTPLDDELSGTMDFGKNQVRLNVPVFQVPGEALPATTPFDDTTAIPDGHGDNHLVPCVNSGAHVSLVRYHHDYSFRDRYIAPLVLPLSLINNPITIPARREISCTLSFEAKILRPMLPAYVCRVRFEFRVTDLGYSQFTTLKSIPRISLSFFWN